MKLFLSIALGICTTTLLVSAATAEDSAKLAGMGGILTGDAWADAYGRDALRPPYGVWINGHWSRDRFGHVYRVPRYTGYREASSPPSRGGWIKGYWKRDAFGHRYVVPGHWGYRYPAPLHWGVE